MSDKTYTIIIGVLQGLMVVATTLVSTLVNEPPRAAIVAAITIAVSAVTDILNLFRKKEATKKIAELEAKVAELEKKPAEKTESKKPAK